MVTISGFPTPKKNFYRVYINTCTYNQSAYIVDTLEGVAMQETNFPFVHQVLDDASTDGEQEVIKTWMARECDMENAEYYDNELCTIILVKNKKNSNYTLATYFLKKNLWKKPEEKEVLFNPWQEVCPYEAHCEGDDYWIDNKKLQKQADFLDNHANVSMVFHRAAMYLEIPQIPTKHFFEVENRYYSATELFCNWTVPTASIMFRKECNDYEIKNKQNILNGDIFTIEKCAHCGEIYGMSDIMSVYRVQHGGVTYNNNAEYERIMRYPKHFECIAENFPKIDIIKIYKKIASAYWKRVKTNTDLKKKIQDCFLTLKYKVNILTLSVIKSRRQ